MWNADGNKLEMVEQEFGIALPFTVKGADIGDGDYLKFTFKTALNGKTVLEKTYSDVVDNTVELIFTEEESGLFSPGTYQYSLDWYRDGEFRCTLVENARFRVVDKA